MNLDYSPVLDEAGKPAGVIAIVVETTEKVRGEAALRASEENFRTLARVMPNQAWTARPDGALDWFNERVYDFSGAKAGDLDGAGWASIVHPDDVQGAAAQWASALAAGEFYEMEFRLRRKDGVWRWHIARAVPVRGATGTIERWIGTNTDIQEQKETAEALAELNATLEQRVADEIYERAKVEDALRQAQKMEAIGQLTGGIAHDFNNLLGAIGGSLSLIERRLKDGKPGAERFIGAGQDAVRRAASLTQRLLAFSR
jgi:PAS domain S-box-containing protein